jgi:hypothetical protein
MHGVAHTLRVGLALFIGFVVFVVLVPTSGAGSRCYSILALSVPCDGALAGVAATISVAIVGLALWLWSRTHPA